MYFIFQLGIPSAKSGLWLRIYVRFHLSLEKREWWCNIREAKCTCGEFNHRYYGTKCHYPHGML